MLVVFRGREAGPFGEVTAIAEIDCNVFSAI